jgi:hypothetical protein
MRLARRHGLEIRWFERKPVLARDKGPRGARWCASFFQAPRVVYATARCRPTRRA